jgi:predicted metalloprotease with PDZ domain
MRFSALATLSVSAIPLGAHAQRTPSAPSSPPAVSAAISDIRYEVQFDKSTAPLRQLVVTMRFTTAGREPVLLSLPAWTPGAYEISNYARWVSGFEASGNGKPVLWDKLDYDTWRVMPNGATAITITFHYSADSLDNAMAWAHPDFAFFNGTNVLLYPEGRPTDFSATVTIKTEADWLVTTGMSSGGAARSYTAKNYHDLVDMPFFVGKFELDSAQVAGKWTRVASYPEGMLTGDARKQFWHDVERFFPPLIGVTGEMPYDTYTIEIVFDSSYGGGSALEHQNSHLGIYTPFIVGNSIFPSITAHEVFHLWNVKRMRPADMVPYRYDRPQPTPWLWVSEGITDYYADLALVRGEIVDSSGFLQLTNGKMAHVQELAPVALEDASVNAWIHPTDGSADIYYDKGSLAGLMLDIMIRDASDNRASLDNVMRDVYSTTYKTGGRGFTAADWWGAVSRAAGGKSFTDVNAEYIDGRDAFPWATVLPLAGMRLRSDTIREPRVGVLTQADSGGVVVSSVEEGSAASEAGVQPGDVLVQIGEIPVADASFGARFRSRYGRADGESIPVTVKRGGQVLTLQMKVRITTRVRDSAIFDRNASPKALRIRNGILKGTTGS